MNFDIKRVKIFVTVPAEKVANIRKAVCEAGAGIIGEYSFCSTSIKSVGTFIPSDRAKPYIGEKNKLIIVEEEKLEVVCAVEKVRSVINAIRVAHPYEEPAIDIVPLLEENEF